MYLMDLVQFALSPSVSVEIKRQAEVQIIARLPQLPLGEKIALTRRGPGRVAGILVAEGHPQVLGQAAACGLPCVARSSYNPDYVIDGVTGLLAGSDDELSAALARLVADADLRRRMSAAAIEHAAKFEWDGVTEQWSKILERAVAERRHA